MSYFSIHFTPPRQSPLGQILAGTVSSSNAAVIDSAEQRSTVGGRRAGWMVGWGRGLAQMRGGQPLIYLERRGERGDSLLNMQPSVFLSTLLSLLLFSPGCTGEVTSTLTFAYLHLTLHLCRSQGSRRTAPTQRPWGTGVWRRP